ncbi:MAG: Uma2 family endonuclease [Cyanobacteria bacterium QH_8_48_120]|nr:MAG: Uma2 family endonuclease [Cyanobacteria bacterium QH_1_48_107]PSO66958.1 MAG: Uma2 family endonuclease [Cyanobacteria bacterium QH_6_48_35]PSO74003.1 MAG: Uma2 family endonuclease [Cyanobacteria bacterium QH_8_48_120]
MAFCQANRELKIERNSIGDIIIMPPTGWGSGDRNAKITYQLRAWSRKSDLGLSFDSSTGFKLPNGAVRSPDAASVKRDRREAINPEPEKFFPLAPDFVMELRSGSDSLKTLQEKMQEYVDNNVRLGWLVDIQNKQVEIYKLGQQKEVWEQPLSVYRESVLPNFMLDLQAI